MISFIEVTVKGRSASFRGRTDRNAPPGPVFRDPKGACHDQNIYTENTKEQNHMTWWNVF